MLVPPFCSDCPCITDENDNCVYDIGKKDEDDICRYAENGESTLPFVQQNVPTTFVKQTRFSGSASENFQFLDEVSGDTFSFKYDVTYISQGVVSLSPFRSDVESLKCSLEGLVTIVLQKAAEVSADTLANMYPVGSVLVIEREHFGACFHSSTGNAFDDSFLIVESASGTPFNAKVRGKVTSYYSMFSEMDIEVLNLDLQAPSPQQAKENEDDVLAECTNPKNIYGKKSVDLDKFVDDSGRAQMILKSTCFSFKKSGMKKLNIKMFDKRTRIATTISTDIGISNLFKVILRPLVIKKKVPIELFAIQISPGGPIKIPTSLPAYLRLGLFFELVLELNVEFNIDMGLSFNAGTCHRLGRKEIEVFLDFEDTFLGIPKPKYNIIVDDPPTFKWIKPEMPKVSPGLIIKYSAALKPTIAARIPSVRATMSFAGSLEVDSKFSTAPQLPIEASALRKSIFGFSKVCEQCHFYRGNVQFLLGKPTLDIIVSFKDREISVFKLVLSFLTLKYYIIFDCTVPAIADDTSTCTDTNFGGGSFMDPHIRTFDGLGYECQASGEFVMSKGKSFEIQARFFGESARGSVITGLASKVENSPVIQFSMAKDSNEKTIPIASCPVLFLADNEMRILSSNVQDIRGVSVLVKSKLITVVYPNNIFYELRVSKSSSFGCFFSRFLFKIPSSLAKDEDILGLLGTPNKKLDDDWRNRDGKDLKIPLFTFGKEAYDYSAQNWCLTSEKKSLFFYEEGRSFDSISKCSRKYEKLDLETFTPKLGRLRTICGSNRECLVDGMVGTEEDARASLAEQEELKGQGIIFPSVTTEIFSIYPTKTYRMGPIQIKLVIDLSNAEDKARSVKTFKAFSINAKTKERLASPDIILRDSGVGADKEKNDKIYSGYTDAYLPGVLNEWSYVALPFSDTGAINDESLIFDSEKKVETFSYSSGVPASPAFDRTEKNVMSLSRLSLQLKKRAGWSEDTKLSVRFGGEVVGPDCGNTEEVETWFTGLKKVSISGNYVRVEVTSITLLRESKSYDIGIDLEKAQSNGLFESGKKVRASVFADVRDLKEPEALTLGSRTLFVDAGTPRLSLLGFRYYTGYFVYRPGGKHNRCASTLIGHVDLSVVGDGEDLRVEIIPAGDTAKTNFRF